VIECRNGNDYDGGGGASGYLSGSTTLVPGTVILTGTPQGVGMAAKPHPRWLRPGDSVSIEIEGIAMLTNSVAFEPLDTPPSQAVTGTLPLNR
jgi:protein involved in polysaccharide export with SLBB domain